MHGAPWTITKGAPTRALVFLAVLSAVLAGPARASAAEKPALWRTMTAIWPAYAEYQARTAREIPVVVIERA